MASPTLLETELNELYQQAAAGQEKGESIAMYRRVAAYILKIVGGGGSLVVATGLLPDWNQMLGIAVLVTVFLDTVSSNHKRLIAEVEAGYAFRALRSRVKGEFNREASPWFEKQKKRGASEASKAEAGEALEKLMREAHVALMNGIRDIRELLQKADVEALKGLSLDQERGGLSK